jgi:hypothetical protein
MVGVSMQGETQVERRISGLTIPWLSSFSCLIVEAFPFLPRGELPFPRTHHLIHLHHARNTPLTLLMVETVEPLALAFLANHCWFLV